jgi:propionyl-CoA synthetase
MRKIADGEEFTTPATIEDPAVLAEIGETLRGIGYARPYAGTASR